MKGLHLLLVLTNANPGLGFFSLWNYMLDIYFSYKHQSELLLLTFSICPSICPSLHLLGGAET